MIRDSADLQVGLEALVRLDPRLEAVAEKAGPLPLRLNRPGFAGLARIIVAQMVSRASADAIWGRIADAAGSEVSARDYLAVAPQIAAGFGLSRAKAVALAAVASAVDDGGLDLLAVTRMDTAQALSQLTALRGIGPWTAEVYLMFCGGHADVFPAGDVALRAAVAHAFGHQARPDSMALRQTALSWSPWRSVAATLFWAYYACAMRRDAAPPA